ncbi:flagellar hook-length control protein FliK [Xanthomonas sp. XNM01]|uniref:flagellar hook-length control protein FliK n=1 Tax=Xanthomonas sp. XNM01 TaxID=2769289 RepID=UPI00177FF4D0|nr:flagellar hook-length control protein FliK [Xanthomonas sp. XNM01]MBD9370933.1 flagellar hook-length control protein FliK [Xanthomonas sp. XNM01]
MIAVPPLLATTGAQAQGQVAPASQPAGAAALPPFGRALATGAGDAGLHDLQHLLAGLQHDAPAPAEDAAVSAPGTDAAAATDSKHAAARSLIAALFAPATGQTEDSEGEPAGIDGAVFAALAGTDLEAVLARALPPVAPAAPVPGLVPERLPSIALADLSASARAGATAGTTPLPASPSPALPLPASPIAAVDAGDGAGATPAPRIAAAAELLLPATAGTSTTAAHAGVATATGATRPEAGQSTSEAGLLGLLGHRIALQSQQGVQQAVVRLEPYMAGTVQVEIRHEAGALRILLTATNDDVVRQLQTVGEGLRQELGARQFTEVSVQVGQQRHSGGDAGQGRHGREDGGASEQKTPGRALGDSDDAYAAFASVLRRMNGAGD